MKIATVCVALALSVPVIAGAADKPRPYVLVHGAWHGACSAPMSALLPGPGIATAMPSGRRLRIANCGLRLYSPRTAQTARGC